MLSIFIPFSVSADTVASPDTGPYIIQCNAYENTYEANDILILVEYDIPYAKEEVHHKKELTKRLKHLSK